MAHANSENTKQRAMSPKPAAKIAEQALGATADLPEAAFAITASLPARVPRTLKFGDTFIVLDSRGDIRNDPGGTLSGGSAGLFHKDTRHLSRLELRSTASRRCCLARRCATIIPLSSSI